MFFKNPRILVLFTKVLSIGRVKNDTENRSILGCSQMRLRKKLIITSIKNILKNRTCHFILGSSLLFSRNVYIITNWMNVTAQILHV